MPAEHIREEIRKAGVIPFARFMELALYCPETGYYERNRDNVGRGGDFITSVSTGEMFGQLLAFQFAQWLETEFRIQNSEFRIVEVGAHDGKLAADILHWLQIHRPKLFSGLEYILLEPSPDRRRWQSERLKHFSNVRWAANFQEISDSEQPTAGRGIIFSNELLDAFPVHRFGWDAKAKNWFEWGVTLDDENFIWTRSAGELPTLRLPLALLEVLPDGYTIETSPAAENWWRQAAQFLTHGKLLAIDYGFTEAEMISPARTQGTLRAYAQHRISDDLLANPGEQDLTAHVNFTAIQNTGEATGLRTEFFGSQPQFLTRILGAAVKENVFASLDAKQVRQFQTLTHPDHLGRAFRVLVQSR